MGFLAINLQALCLEDASGPKPDVTMGFVEWSQQRHQYTEAAMVNDVYERLGSVTK